MKKTKNISLVLFIGVIFLFIGCASTASTTTTQGFANTVQEAHPDRFEKTVIGMDVNEFKTVWPEATKTGSSEDGEVYEFIYIRLYDGFSFSPGAYLYKIYTTFYFTNDKLVEYESTQKTGL